MEVHATELQGAFEAYLAALSATLEAKDEKSASKERSDATALVAVTTQLQAFHSACDKAQAFVEKTRQQVLLDSLQDEAGGSAVTRAISASERATQGLSARQLEAVTGAVRTLAGELYHGSGHGLFLASGYLGHS